MSMLLLKLFVNLSTEGGQKSSKSCLRSFCMTPHEKKSFAIDFWPLVAINPTFSWAIHNVEIKTGGSQVPYHKI